MSTAMKAEHIEKLRALQEQLMKMTSQARDLQYALGDLLREVEDTDPETENRLVNAIGVIEGFAGMDTDLLSHSLF